MKDPMRILRRTCGRSAAITGARRAGDSNALGAHGYRRVVEYLSGLRDLTSAIEQTKLDVRHYSNDSLLGFG